MHETSGRESPAGRRTRARLKELLLQAAEEVLDRDGLGFNTDTITYKAVFAHLEESQGIRVTRGSVHERIWDSQREFQLEVIQRAAHWTPEHSYRAMVEAARQVISEADRSSDAARWAATREAVREGARAFYRSSEEQDRWSQWVGLTLALASRRGAESSEAKLMIEGARRSYREMTDDLMKIHEIFLEAMQNQIQADTFPNPTQALETLTQLLTALADGVALRERFDPEVTDELSFRAEPGADAENWHPFSLAAWALADFFLEPSR